MRADLPLHGMHLSYKKGLDLGFWPWLSAMLLHDSDPHIMPAALRTHLLHGLYLVPRRGRRLQAPIAAPGRLQSHAAASAVSMPLRDTPLPSTPDSHHFSVSPGRCSFRAADKLSLSKGLPRSILATRSNLMELACRRTAAHSAS